MTSGGSPSPSSAPHPGAPTMFTGRFLPALGCAAIGCLVVFAAHLGIAVAKWLLVGSTTGWTGPLTGLIGGRERPLALWLGALALFGVVAALVIAAFDRRTVLAAIVATLAPVLIYQVALTLVAGYGVLRGLSTPSDWLWAAGVTGIHDLAGPVALVGACCATALAWRRVWR